MCAGGQDEALREEDSERNITDRIRTEEECTMPGRALRRALKRDE